MDLSLNTVIKRAKSGKIPAKISEEIPFLNDGTENYLIRLEALPQNAQLRYLRTRIPEKQQCSLDLATPRSAFGDVWIPQFINVADIIRQAERIRWEYRTTGKVAEKLKQLASKNGISLATLYRTKCTQKVHENWKTPAFYAIIEVDKSGIGVLSHDDCLQKYLQG